MLKIKEGKIKVKGEKPEVMADNTTIIEYLVGEGHLTKEDVDFCVKLSRMSHEQKAELAMSMMFEEIGKLFTGGEGDEDGE